MTEANLMRHIQVARSAKGARLFRNNCGQLRNDRGQWIRFGVANPGGSDLIGWKSIIITPKMVGKRVAVFATLEIKLPDASLTEPQQRFINAAQNAGAIAGVARSVEEAAGVFDGWEDRL